MEDDLETERLYYQFCALIRGSLSVAIEEDGDADSFTLAILALELAGDNLYDFVEQYNADNEGYNINLTCTEEPRTLSFFFVDEEKIFTTVGENDFVEIFD